MDTPDHSARDTPAADAATPRRHDAMIERWFAAHFHGAPQMRDTDAFNHVRRAVDDLKRRLAEEN